MNSLNKFKRKLKTPTLKMKKNGGGFTLVEAIVVTAVIGIISSMMIVNWRKSERQYEIQRTAQGMAQNTRKVQDMALSGVKAAGLTNVPVAYGISFELLTTPNSYKICADTNSDNKCATGDEWTKEILLESGVIVDSVYKLKQDETEEDDSLHIMFSIPDGFVFFGRADVIGAIIRIRRAEASCPSNNCRDIIIRQTGEVSIE